MSADPFARVGPGQPVFPALRAPTFNALVAAAEAHQRGRLGGGGGRLTDDPQAALYVSVRNDTGSDLPARAVVRLGAAVVHDPAERPYAAAADPVFAGTFPVGPPAGGFAVLAEPVRAGGIGRAAAAGVAVCDLVGPAGGPFAGAGIPAGGGGGTAALVAGSTGPARVLWQAPGGGPRRAVVLIGDGSGVAVTTGFPRCYAGGAGLPTRVLFPIEIAPGTGAISFRPAEVLPPCGAAPGSVWLFLVRFQAELGLYGGDTPPTGVGWGAEFSVRLEAGVLARDGGGTPIDYYPPSDSTRKLTVAEHWFRFSRLVIDNFEYVLPQRRTGSRHGAVTVFGTTAAPPPGSLAGAWALRLSVRHAGSLPNPGLAFGGGLLAPVQLFAEVTFLSADTPTGLGAALSGLSAADPQGTPAGAAGPAGGEPPGEPFRAAEGAAGDEREYASLSAAGALGQGPGNPFLDGDSGEES